MFFYYGQLLFYSVFYGCKCQAYTYDEAVVDVELESVANLIKDACLKDAVTKALRIYIATRGTNIIGFRNSDCSNDLLGAIYS